MKQEKINNIRKLVNSLRQQGVIPIKDIFIGKDIPSRVKESIDIYPNCAVVCDNNTFNVLGGDIVEVLKDKAILINLGIKPKADLKTVKYVKKQAKDVRVLIAVGTGTINDICKYASYLDDKNYIVLPTAPSMNGYSSSNASLMVNGYKKSFIAHLPSSIFIDLDVNASAPLELIQSGFGDVLCRSTCQCDWFLAKFVTNSRYKRMFFDIMQPIEKELILHAETLKKRDIHAISLLIEALIFSGICMYISGSSRPASQGEHMIAHTMEMVYPQLIKNSYHGQQIAVTTLTMAEIQEQKMQYMPIKINTHYKEWELESFFGERLAKKCLYEYRNKLGAIKANNINLITTFDQAKIKKIKSELLPFKKLKKALKQAGCPTKPEDIGISEEEYSNCVKFAKYTRDRFTFLDL